MALTRKRAVVVAVAATLAAGFGASVYLDRVLIPAEFKGRIERSLGAPFGRPAAVQEVHFSPAGGFVLRGLAVARPGEAPLLSAAVVRARLSWLALLTRRRVVLSSLELLSPRLAVGLDEARLLLRASSGRAGAASVRRVTVVDGECRLLLPGPRELLVEGLAGEASADGSGGYTASFSGGLGSREGLAPFRLGAGFGRAGVRADLAMRDVPGPILDPFLRTFKVRLGARSVGPLSARLTDAGGRAEVAAHAEVQGFFLAKSGFHLRSDALVWSDITFGGGEPPAHTTRVRLLSGELEPWGAMPRLTGIRGDVVLTTAGARGEGLDLEMVGMPLSLGGRMDGYSAPYFEIAARSGPVDLRELSRLRPRGAGAGPGPREGGSPGPGLRLRGPSRFELRLHGTAKTFLSSLNGRLDLEAASLSGGALPKAVRDLRGRVDFTADSARWAGLAFVYAGKAYASSGIVKEFRNPRVRAGARSRDSYALLEAAIQGPLVRVFRLRGRGPAVRFDVAGTVDRRPGGAVQADLEGTAQASMPDAAVVLPARAGAAVRRAGLAGVLRFQGRVAGDVSRPADWRVHGVVGASGLSAYGLALSSASFSLSQEGRRAQIRSLSARGYSGTVTGDSSIDFSGAAPRQETTLVLQGVDLGQLKGVPRLASWPLSGIIDLRAQASGPLADLSAMDGWCKLRVREGRFFQFPLLGRVGDIVLGRKRNDVVFSEASGNLRFEGGVIRSDNLRLRSDAVVLAITGSVRPGGPLDLTVHTELNDRLLHPTFDVLRYAVRLAGNLGILVTIHVTGTTLAPVYTILPVPIDWLKRLKEMLFGK